MIKKFFIIIGIVVGFLLTGLFVSYDYWLERELKYQLSEIINKDPNSLYRYSFKKLNINLIDGSVDLLGISIEPKDQGYDNLLSDTSAVRFLLKLQLAEIELVGFETREFINTGRIIVQEIKLVQPTFAYYFNPEKPNQEQKMPLSAVFSDKFKSAKIEHFYIFDGQLEIDNYLTQDPAILVNYFNIDLHNAYMDSSTLQNVVPLDYEEIKFVAGSISADISENYSIISDSLYFNALEESFIIRDFQIKPKHSQEVWASMHEVQKQWFALTLDAVSLRNINLEHFVKSGEIKVGRIRIRQPNVALYKDKRKPESSFIKKLLPASAISSIPIKINVDTVQIINGYIAIQETSKLTGLNSHVSFYNLNGLLTNFTNLPATERQSNIMELNASTMMYKQAPIHLNIRFDLASPIDKFYASGRVESVDMTVFNPILEPIMAAKVLDGRLQNLNFEFQAMDTISNGVLDMEYTNAKIEILNQDTTQEKQKLGFLTFAANTIIKTNNDRTKAGYVQGIIQAKRVLNKDVWPFLWHSVQSGIISTMAPITNNKETKQQQKILRKQLRLERKEGKD